MTEQEFLEEFAVVMGADPKTVLPDTELESLEAWDSMGVLGVVALLDRVAGKGLEITRLAECTKVQDLVDIVRDKLQ